MSQVVGSSNSYKPINNTAWVRVRLCKLQKWCTRLTAASDKVQQLVAHGRWFSPGTPASSTTKTGRHDIAEILLKVALKHQKSNQIKSVCRNHNEVLNNGFVTSVRRRVAHVEQELLTLPGYLSLLPVFSRVFVTRSSVFCVMLSYVS